MMSMAQLLLTTLVALLVFGPTKLPMLAHHLGLLINRINGYKQQASLLWQKHLLKQQFEENSRKAQEADRRYQQENKEL